MRAAPLVLLVVALAPAAARAQPLVLPSRHPDAAALAARAAAVERALARHTGAPAAAPAAQDAALGPALRAAAALHASGKLDEAADTFDVALARGARAPHTVQDPAGFVTAHVARASIALARGEKATARALLARLLRYDPTFQLEAAEDSPSMRAALDAVRAELGARPDLAPDDAGSPCAATLVARFTPEGVELLRLRDCVVIARVVAAPAQRPDELALLLAGDDARPTPRAPTPIIAAPSRDTTAPPPPFYRRAWFWIAVGGVVAASAGTAYWLARDDGAGDQLDVMPHF